MHRFFDDYMAMVLFTLSTTVTLLLFDRKARATVQICTERPFLDSTSSSNIVIHSQLIHYEPIGQPPLLNIQLIHYQPLLNNQWLTTIINRRGRDGLDSIPIPIFARNGGFQAPADHDDAGGLPIAKHGEHTQE